MHIYIYGDALRAPRPAQPVSESTQTLATLKFCMARRAGKAQRSSFTLDSPNTHTARSNPSSPSKTEQLSRLRTRHFVLMAESRLCQHSRHYGQRPLPAASAADS